MKEFILEINFIHVNIVTKSSIIGQTGEDIVGYIREKNLINVVNVESVILIVLILGPMKDGNITNKGVVALKYSAPGYTIYTYRKKAKIR